MANIVGMGVEAILTLALTVGLDWPKRRPPWYELFWCGVLVYLDVAGFLHNLYGWASARAGDPIRAILYFCLVVLFALTQVLSAVGLYRVVLRSFRAAPAGWRKASLWGLLGFLPQFFVGAWRASPVLPTLVALAVVALPAALGAAERTRRRVSA